MSANRVDTPIQSPEALGFKRAKNDRAWDWVQDVAVNIRGYLRAPAAILPFLRDQRLKESLAAKGQSAQMVDLINRLSDDTVKYTERFQAIYSKHAGRTGNSTNPDDLMMTLMIGQDYIQFMTSYESVVMATLQEILELLEHAGLDTASVKPLTDGTVVYDLYGKAPSPSDPA